MRTTPTLLITFLALLAGCSSLKRPFPDKTLHAIRIGDPSASATSQASRSKMILRVDRVVVAEPYDGTPFVYQVGDSTYESDYYNGFVGPPGRLLTGEIGTSLTRSGVFATVLTGDSSADYQLSLETNVTAMYGDYRPGQKHAAVLAARFFVVDQSQGGFTVIFDKTYTQSTPLQGDGPDALVKAWEIGWTNLMAQLVDDLRKAPVVMNGR